jgi:hypothetical protein
MSDKEDNISKFIEIKLKLDELQKRHDKYRKIVEEHMIQQGLTSIEHTFNNQNYKIKKSILSRESISKKELPQDIWEKYCKSSSYSTLRISKIK